MGRKASTALPHRKLVSQLDSLEGRYRDARGRDRQRLFVSGDLSWLAEMTLVSAVTAWEAFTFETMLVCVNRDASRLAESLDLPLPQHLPIHLCEAILAGVRYFEVRGVEELRGAARKYLVPHHNPFERIGAAAARKVDEAVKIRHFILHRSRHAARTYRRVLSENGLKRSVSPGRFLVAELAAGSPRVFLYLYIAAMRQASGAMEGSASVPVDRVREAVVEEAGEPIAACAAGDFV